MSEALRLPPSLPSPPSPTHHHHHHHHQERSNSSSIRRLGSFPSFSSSWTSIPNRPICCRSFRGPIAAAVAASTSSFFFSSSSSWESVGEGSRQTKDEEEGEYLDGGVGVGDEAPASVELEAVVTEEKFDRIVAEAQQLEVPVVVLWMANWCRKCIYLKPKLEKLAAEYHPRIRFYCVDVNSVPHQLVKRAGVTKMPTIQLWKDSEKRGEVIGGHKAWLVVDDVRQMIENES